MTNAEARKKMKALQDLSPKEREVAIAIIKVLDNVPEEKRADILKQAYDKCNESPSLTVEQGDLEQFPYEGICGKCAIYKPKLDNNFLCEFCLLMGVKFIKMTPEQRKQAEHLVRLRPRPTPQAESEGGEEKKFDKFGRLIETPNNDRPESLFETCKRQATELQSLKESNERLVEALEKIFNTSREQNVLEIALKAKQDSENTKNK